MMRCKEFATGKCFIAKPVSAAKPSSDNSREGYYTV